MHRSCTTFPSVGLRSTTEQGDSTTASPSPPPINHLNNDAAALISLSGIPVQSMASSLDLLHEKDGSRLGSGIGNTSTPSHSVNDTGRPVPALGHTANAPPLAGLRRPRRVLMRGPTASLFHPGSSQMLLSPVGAPLSRQTSMAGQSISGIRGVHAGSQLPLSPTASNDVAGSRRGLNGGEATTNQRVWPPTAGTTGNQMGRNLDSHAYLQTHVIAGGGQRFVLSPNPAALPMTANQSLLGTSGVLSPRITAGILGSPVVLGRATPMPGAASLTPSLAVLPSASSSVTPVPPASQQQQQQQQQQPSRRPIVSVGTVETVYPTRTLAHAARHDTYLARPTSPLSEEISLMRLNSPGPPLGDAVARTGVPSVSGNMASTSPSDNAACHTVGPLLGAGRVVTEPGSTAVPAMNSACASSSSSAGTHPATVRRLRSDVGAEVASTVSPPQPSWPLAYFQRRPKIDSLEECLRLNAASANTHGLATSQTPPDCPSAMLAEPGEYRRSQVASPVAEEATRGAPRGGCGAGTTGASDNAVRPHSVFGLFGLLERTSRFEELYGLYAHHPFLREFYSSVRSHISTISRHERLPWMAKTFHIIFYLLDNPSEAEKVGLEYYRNPMIAWPLHVLYLVSCYYVTAQQYGFTTLHEALRNSGGLLAMGKGLFAAIAVATANSEDALRKQTARMMCASFTLGVIMRRRLSTWEQHLDYSTSHSFSFLLVNIPVSTLHQLVNEVNECRGVDFEAPEARRDQLRGAYDGSFSNTSMKAAGASKTGGSQTAAAVPRANLEVSRIISSRSAVVCGHPLDLDRLDIVLTRFADNTGVKIHKDFIPSCAPENSGYYNEEMAFELLACWQYSDTIFDPKEIYIPLFSPVQGERWDAQTVRTPEQFSRQVAEAVTYRHQDLTYSLHHITDGDCLLDFSTMPLTTGAVVEWTNRQFDIISVPINRREHAVLPPPRRSQQPSGVRGTLFRLAMVNVVLDELVRENIIRVPREWCVEGPNDTVRLATGVEMSTTFGDLGLLHYVKKPHAQRALAGARHDRTDTNRSLKHTNAATTTATTAATPMKGASEHPRRTSAVVTVLTNDKDGRDEVAQAVPEDGSTTGRADMTCASPLGGTRGPMVHSINSTVGTAGGSSSRSGGGETVVPGQSATSAMDPLYSSRPADNDSTTYTATTATTSNGNNSANGATVAMGSAPTMHSRRASSIEVAALSEELVHAMPTILEADDNSNTTSPMHQNTRQSMRCFSPLIAEESGEAQLFSTSVARGLNDASSLTATSPSRQREKTLQSDFVIQQNAYLESVVNVYQVSPLVRYYEMQFGCVLRDGAIAFTERLKSKTGMNFPPYMLLMCPTVFALLELWDGYQFVDKYCRE